MPALKNAQHERFTHETSRFWHRFRGPICGLHLQVRREILIS
jgi:hypothetical protein